ncbi:MAG: YfhO family protein [Anaerorhabdus sp.]|uniref:YfhO family protein n=1 Tax=Anaerorhabdus sp. TaxID=1872524 RepID=UPI003A85801F
MKKLLITVGLILGIFYVLLLIQGNGVLIFWGDGADQYMQFTTYAYEMIKGGNFSFWGSSLGLGANIFTMFFTVLGSPSFYLMLLCPRPELHTFNIPLFNRVFGISQCHAKIHAKI